MRHLKKQKKTMNIFRYINLEIILNIHLSL